jgi:selenium-binding protein 1
MAKLDADTDGGGLTVDNRFFPIRRPVPRLRVHQTRLQAGDASSDSYCYTS